MGALMEHQLAIHEPFDEHDLASVSVTRRSACSGLRCALPLGKPMICGETRRREALPPDSEVLSDSTPSRDVWFIRTGILRLQRYGYDGRRQILSLYLPGEIVGYEGQFREGVNIETVTQSGLCRIDRHKFESMLVQSSTLRADLFRQKQDQLDRLQWLTWTLGAMGPEERLCAFLALSSKFLPYQPLPDGSGILSMLLPRKDIADLLTTTAETICRVLYKLSEKGLIEIWDPAHFRILDLKELIKLGQVDALFDRTICGLAKQFNRQNALTALNSDCPACFCGR
jgi:CRP/FNR family transcriptional regulator